jgi:signal transduction histidine kinase
MRFDALTRDRNLQFWVLHTLGWSAYAAAQFLGALVYDKPVPYQLVIAIAATSGWLLSLPLRYVHRRLWARGPRAIVVVTPLACWVLGLSWRAVINYSFMELVEPEMPWGPNPLELFAGALSSTWLLLCWSGLYFGIKYYESLQHEREASLRSEALARDAQLKMLRYQLNPHFLFNTLNAISTLVLDGQNRTANQAVARLSEFLRYTLDQDPMKKVTLRQELDALGLYLGIEQLRYDDRLHLVFDVDEAARAALVPSLLLQPLIENALKYAVSPREAGGTIRISAHAEGARVVIAVADDGPGLPPGGLPAGGRGVGLRNTRDRLQVLYGERHSFTLEDARPGLRVVLSFPIEV